MYKQLSLLLVAMIVGLFNSCYDYSEVKSENSDPYSQNFGMIVPIIEPSVSGLFAPIYFENLHYTNVGISEGGFDQIEYLPITIPKNGANMTFVSISEMQTTLLKYNHTSDTFEQVPWTWTVDKIYFGDLEQPQYPAVYYSINNLNSYAASSDVELARRFSSFILDAIITPVVRRDTTRAELNITFKPNEENKERFIFVAISAGAQYEILNFRQRGEP